MSKENEDELVLLPSDPETDLARQAIMETQLPIREAPIPNQPPKLQFGVSHLLIATTVVAGFAALNQWLSARLILTMIGVCAFFSLLLIRIIQPDHPIFYFTWWCLFVVYLVFAMLVVVSAI